MQSLGTVISTELSPTTMEFAFVLDTNSPVRKGQFVQTTSEEGIVFGFVAEIARANRYFERAESVAEYEREAPISSHFPIKSWEYTIADVKILGRMEKRGEHYFQQRVSLPPSPGTKVIEADEPMLKDFVGFTETGLHIGKLQHHEVAAKIDLTRLFQKHLAILAMSGAGKCLEYNTPIMLADGTHKKIGEIADEAFCSGETAKEDGTEIAFPKEGVSVLSLNSQYKLSKNKVYAITRRSAPRELVALRTRTGREVTLTKGHPLLVISGKGPQWREAGEVAEGEYIAVPRQMLHGETSEINLLEFYKDSEEMCVFGKQVLNELGKTLREKGGKRSRKFAYWISQGSMPIRTFFSLCKEAGREDLISKAEKIKRFGSQEAIPAKLKLNRKLGSFTGYLMGDGHVSGNCLDLSALTPEIREDFINISKELFGFNASAYPTSVRVHSKTLVCMMKDLFGVEPSAEKKHVSSHIFSANKEFVAGFLSGLFDTDGSVSICKPEIEFCSKSRKLAEGTATLLLRFGILPIIKTKYNKKYQCGYNIVYARGAPNLGVFLKEISFVSDKKRSRLEAMASLHPNTNIDVIPSLEPLLSELMAKLMVSESELARRAGVANNLSRYGNGEDALSRETFRKISAALSARAEELKDLCLLVDSISIPSCEPETILSECNCIKCSGNMEYREIASHCKVSEATVRRMLCKETTITESLLGIGRAISEAQGGAERLDAFLGEYEEFCNASCNLIRIADDFGFSYRLLDRCSGLHKGAWASYKSGERRPSLDSKARMARGLKLAASEMQMNLGSAARGLRLLESLSDSSILWDEVAEARPVEAKHNYVYDMALKENHNFLAGEIPLVVHNSHLASVMLEELLERPKEQGRIAVVVIDIHGEYVGFKFDPNYGRKVRIVSGKEMCIPFRQLSPGLISTWFTEISSVGRNELAKIMREMSQQEKNERQVFGVPDLIKKVETADMPKSTKDSLLRALYELKALNLISQSKEIPNLRQNVQPGEMLVLDLSDMDDMRKKKLIVSYVASRLFNLRRKEQIPPTFLLVEEAHNFAPEKAKAAHNPSKSIIEKIAREGRKFGLALGVVSQRPVQLSTTTLSQCNSHIILRVTNPNDLKHIGESSEGIDQRMLRAITTLKVGEGIIVGEAVRYPIFVEIRDRKSRKMEKGKPLHEQALSYEASAKKADEEADEELEAFL